MSISIKLKEKKFGAEKSRGMWYARVVRGGDVTTKQLAERIQRNSTFKTGEVYGIIMELLETMKACLQDGQTVDLEGFGRFHLTVESTPVKEREKFRSDRDVRAVKCKFRPAGRRRKDGRIVELLAEGCKVDRVDTK